MDMGNLALAVLTSGMPILMPDAKLRAGRKGAYLCLNGRQVLSDLLGLQRVALHRLEATLAGNGERCHHAHHGCWIDTAHSHHAAHAHCKVVCEQLACIRGLVSANIAALINSLA